MDALLPSLVEKVAELLPWARLRNGWGASEAGWAIAGEVNPAGNPQVVPLGRPVVNTQILILDSDMERVPEGEFGELCVASSQVVRGYLGCPDLTAEKFVPSPFGRPGERMYRTGDRCCSLPDGQIALAERIDRMVKIRGFRVEPREVETTLLRHAHLREAVVSVDESDGEKQLVAFIVPDSDTVPTPLELRRFLAERVPDYMVPSFFVVMDSIPRNSHGKTDWSALPRPSESRPETSKVYVAPRDARERELADIWARLFRLERVGITDNFFELGGDSLLAARLLTEVGKAFTLDIPPSALFRAPTIEQLAAFSWSESPECSSSLVPLETRGLRTPFFWLHGEASDFLLPRYLGPDQPLYGIPHQGEDGKPAAHTTIEEMAAHNVRAVRSVQAEGPYLLGGYCFGGLVAFEMAHQLSRAGQEVGLLVIVNPLSLDRSGSRPAPVEASVYSEVRRHARNLTQLAFREWIMYLLRRAVGKLRGLVQKQVHHWERIVKSVVCRVCLGFGYKLPPGVRSFYILSVYQQALKEYAARPWSGRIVVLRGRSDSRELEGWEALAGGGLEVSEITGDHISVLREPHVRSLARELGAYLRRVDRNPRYKSKPDISKSAVRANVSS